MIFNYEKRTQRSQSNTPLAIHQSTNPQTKWLSLLSWVALTSISTSITPLSVSLFLSLSLLLVQSTRRRRWLWWWTSFLRAAETSVLCIYIKRRCFNAYYKNIEHAFAYYFFLSFVVGLHSRARNSHDCRSPSITSFALSATHAVASH